MEATIVTRHTSRSAFGKVLHDGVDIYDPVQHRAHRAKLETEQQDSFQLQSESVYPYYRVSDKLVCGLFFVDAGAIREALVVDSSLLSPSNP